MKIRYYELKQKPRLFKSFFGITVAEFEELYAQVEPVWEAQERERLMMTLMWLKLYLNQELLGYLFGIDKSNVSRNVWNLMPTLRVLGEATLGWATPPARGQTQNLAQAQAEYPELFAIIDATEQPVQRSSNDETQREHYSGKKKRHTRKTQLIVNERGEIRDVSHSTPGRVHDLEHFRQSGAADRIPEELGGGGDAGYQGLQNELPEHSVATAHKARRNHPLTQAEKDINREFSAMRIVVENTIAELKHFRVLADRFRHDLASYDTVFRAVVALVNPRIQKRVAVSMPT